MPDIDEAASRQKWIKPLARAGYAARGLVYLVVAFFAFLAAWSGAASEDTKGAIEFLTKNHAGDVLAILLVASLAGYSIWRFFQTTFDTDDHGVGLKGLGIRAGLLASGITYGVLAFYTYSLWRGSSNADDGDFAHVLARFVGAQATALVLAAVFAIVGGAHIVKAIRRKYRNHISADRQMMRYVDPIAMAGLSARGAIFGVIALLLFRRGLAAGENGGTPGLREALDFIISLPLGSMLLGVTAVGLLAFSLYSFIEAGWRRINVEDA